MEVINPGAVTYCLTEAAKSLPAGEYLLYVQPVTGAPDARAVLAESAKWLHAAYDRPPITPEAAAMLERVDKVLSGSPAPTMEDAIAAGDGTLHGAIDHWQERALKAEDELADCRDCNGRGWVAAAPVAQAGEATTTFAQAERLLKECLKPEEISGPLRADRLSELVRWFVRLADQNANPKWLYGHAMELAYAVATANLYASHAQAAPTPEKENPKCLNGTPNTSMPQPSADVRADTKMPAVGSPAHAAQDSSTEFDEPTQTTKQAWWNGYRAGMEKRGQAAPTGSDATPARKVGGSYQAEGVIVARFRTRAGAERVVFEFNEPRGMLHIFGAEQVEIDAERVLDCSDLIKRTDHAA